MTLFQPIIDTQLRFPEARFQELLRAIPLGFADMTPSRIPHAPGVYVITAEVNGNLQPYYRGRTKSLRQGLYNNHLMGL